MRGKNRYNYLNMKPDYHTYLIYILFQLWPGQQDISLSGYISSYGKTKLIHNNETQWNTKQQNTPEKYFQPQSIKTTCTCICERETLEENLKLIKIHFDVILKRVKGVHTNI